LKDFSISKGWVKIINKLRKLYLKLTLFSSKMKIYQPAEDSYLLQEQVRKYVQGRVLDIGTGSGIQALTAIGNPNVREVIAIDINEEAVETLQKEIMDMKLRKIKAIKSDLFENVHGHFNLMIFNAPYLPQDKIGDEEIKDAALYGGKKGWELSERFFKKASKFLFHDGKILFLFSTLTNKEKIEEIIVSNLFDFKEISFQKLAFETIYVYEIEKSKLLRELESKNIEDIGYLTHGKRGDIFVGKVDKSKLIKTHFPSKKNIVKVAIKVKRRESKAIGRIENEVKWLKLLNKNGIGPRLMFSSENYFVYRFVEGEFILGWIKKSDSEKKEISNVLVDLLKQCKKMDDLSVNKEEMHHPQKHILINERNEPVLLDFERCHQTEKPGNVTQFIEFICRVEKELAKKDFKIDVNKLRELAKEYKGSYANEVFNEIESYIR